MEALAKPLRQTDYGYHIVKEFQQGLLLQACADKANTEVLQQKIMADDRWKTARNFIYERVKPKTCFISPPTMNQCYGLLSDSLLDSKPLRHWRKAMNTSSPLFTLEIVLSV